MKFNGPKQSEPIRLTVEDVIAMHEQEIALRNEAMAALEDPINAFVTIAGRAEQYGVKASIESLSDSEASELSDVFGLDRASLEAMTVEEFVNKCNEFIGTEPAQEGLGDIAGYVVGAIVASAAIKQVADNAFANNFKKVIDAIPSNKKADAMKAFTVVTWKHDDYVDRISASNEALDYCKQSVENLFENDNLVELEKIADALGQDPVRYENGDDQLKAWSEWAAKGYERETAKTLDELGFTPEKLTSVVQNLHDFAVRYTEIMAKVQKDHQKYTKRGFFAALGEMFSKKKAEEGARKREIANTKFHAMKCIMNTVRVSTNGLCADIIVIGDKARRLAKSDNV